MLDCKDDDKRCCAVQVGACYLIMPRTCVECRRQDCCLETRCAFPCTQQVYIFLICFVEMLWK